MLIRFRVSDSGIGISLDQQRNIFDPFVQNRVKSNRQYHGTGLGLTIANRLVALHGSELSMASAEGKGTTFEFQLEYGVAGIAAEIPRDAEQSEARTLDSLRVLVAEDNAINVLVIKKWLNVWGISPVIAVNGAEAVEQVKAEDFDVVLMDINMPVMDGFEASKNIRALDDPKKAGIRIIAVTASIGASIELHKGFEFLDDCILKPFKPEVLKEKLTNVFK